MVLMEKGKVRKFVPDVFVSKYAGDGYSIVGATAEKAAEAVPEKPTKAKKPKRDITST